MANNKKITRSDLATARRSRHDMARLAELDNADKALFKDCIDLHDTLIEMLSKIIAVPLDTPLCDREVREVRSLFLTANYSDVDLAGFYGVSIDQIEQAL